MILGACDVVAITGMEKRVMKRVARLLFVLSLLVLAGTHSGHTQTKTSSAEKAIIADFQKRAKRYVERREWLRGQLPKLPVDATPEQIQSFQRSLQDTVQADRINMREGDVFTQQIARLMRELIKKEFVGFERTELRARVLEADTKGVPLKANTIYPATKELVQMPPTLLLALPELPRELRYRFIGRSLAILDRDSSLIVDVMRDALP